MILFFSGWVLGGFVVVLSWPIGLAIVIISTILSLFPLEGYEEEKLIETIELIKLDDVETAYYIQKVGKRVYYACDIRGRYNLPTPAREIRCVKGNVKVFESVECNDPVLKVYRKKPIREVASIAPFSTKTTYVFYIPKKVSKKDNRTKSSDVTVFVRG